MHVLLCFLTATPVCQGLEEKLSLNYTALQELREKHLTGKEDGTCAFITQTDDLIKACTALSQEVSSGE